MKHFYFTLFILLSTTVSAVEIDSASTQQFDAFKQSFTDWDERRGEWLAVSLKNMAIGEEIPTRTFPESLTPFQMLMHVPAENRKQALDRVPVSNIQGNTNYWSAIHSVMQSSECSTIRSRSYGDPHIADLNGNRYSFQTVGEFVLLENNQMEVQVRQEAVGENFSLNTAVAMNVNGDRVCIYADDYPDVTTDTPVRLNGRPIYVTGSTYFLPHGGTITKANNQYTVYFATGEIVTAKLRSRSMDGFMDVSADISKCRKNEYTGFIVDPQGRVMADNATRNYTSDAYMNKTIRAEKVRLFAQPFRVTDVESLFDYPLGRTTAYYTDLTYPRVTLSIDDLNKRDLRRSSKYCESLRGTPAYNSCVFDNGFLDLERAPDPVVPTGREVVVQPLPDGRLIDNVNPGERPRPVSPRFSNVKESAASNVVGTGTNPRPQTLPTHKGEKQDVKKPTSTTHPSLNKPATKKPEAKKPTVNPKPVIQSKPVVKPNPKPKPVVKPVTRPKPVVKPRPKPVVRPKPAPRPAPKPKPVPKPSPQIKKGR